MGKDNVKLRSRLLRNGSRSLYLDIYDRGARKYEYLNLYLLPQSDAGAKVANEHTLRIAESVRAQRIIEINSGRYDVNVSAGKVAFFPVFSSIADKRGDAYHATLIHLQRYERRNITFADITREWLKGFQSYLNDQPLKQNTRWQYWTKLASVLHMAFREGIIQRDIISTITAPRKEVALRVFLTPSELRILANTPCDDDTRRIFLFSCLTGLRYSDCCALLWSQVEDSAEGCRIIFRQQKTKGMEYLIINSEARAYMGERGEGNVFRFIPISTLNWRIKRWAKDAGLRKHLSFHCARHTFATMLLSLGTDIYVVSRLLGHTSVSTTQIYAHIVDEQKRDAVSRLPKISD